jgi:hypothetical protein
LAGWKGCIWGGIPRQALHREHPPGRKGLIPDQNVVGYGVVHVYGRPNSRTDILMAALKILIKGESHAVFWHGRVPALDDLVFVQPRVADSTDGKTHKQQWVQEGRIREFGFPWNCIRQWSPRRAARRRSKSCGTSTGGARGLRVGHREVHLAPTRKATRTGRKAFFQSDRRPEVAESPSRKAPRCTWTRPGRRRTSRNGTKAGRNGQTSTPMVSLENPTRSLNH